MLDLYETYYKLTADPFRLSPDHRFVLDHRSYAKSKSYLEYALHRGEGFIVITGGAGTGKTTLINEIHAQLDKTRIQVATLNSTQMESRDLLHMVVASFGLPLKEMDKATLLLSLEEFLKQQAQKGRRAVLIVDEAQGLSSAALEELRLLANLQFNNRLLMQVFLIGQESLRELISEPGMDHLRQRIVAASHLEPLKLTETVDYVEHRLSRVGWQGDPKIDAEALRLIHQFSGGIPRRINLICSRLFLFGAMEKKHALVAADAKNVIEDLQQEQLMAPVAERGNGTTGAPSRIGGAAEKVALISVDSLPREKKTVINAGAASPQPASLNSSIRPVTGSARRAHAVEPEYDKVGEAEPSSQLPENENDIWGEIEQLKQELSNCQDLEADNDIMVDASPELAEGETLAPKADGRTEKNDHPVTPRPVNRVMRAEPRPSHQVRMNRKRQRRRRSLVKVISVLLLLGLVLAVILRRDDIGRTIATVSESIIGTQESLIQREDPDASEPSDHIVRGNTNESDELDAEPADSPANTESEKTVVSAHLPGKKLATDAAIDPPQTKLDSPHRQPGAGVIKPGDDNLVASPVPETVVKPVKPGPDLAVDTHTADGADTTVSLHQSEGKPSVEVLEEAGGSPENRKPVSKQAALPAEKETMNVRPLQTTPVPAITVSDTTAERKPDVAQASIETQQARLRDEARQRLNQHLSELRPATEKTVKALPVPSDQAVAGVKPEVLAVHEKPKKVRPSLPKPSVQKTRPAPTVIVKAPKSNSRTAVTGGPDKVRSALLVGHWTSRGKPATLLPSEITHCQQEEGRVSCWSVPQNVNTQYGEAKYKVETTLQAFSVEGQFQLSYKTLVRLLRDDSSENGKNASGASADKDGWQVTEKNMTCQLVQSSKILCHDEKGTKREYLRP